MDQDSVHMVAASKVPMLKLGEYELWRMRMEPYIQMVDYALWEVRENGNTAPKTTLVEGVEKVIPPTTTEDPIHHTRGAQYAIPNKSDTSYRGGPIRRIRNSSRKLWNILFFGGPTPRHHCYDTVPPSPSLDILEIEKLLTKQGDEVWDLSFAVFSWSNLRYL
ncbi:hypothetical protein Tco_0775128 [Tanacetum coccineum]